MDQASPPPAESTNDLPAHQAPRSETTPEQVVRAKAGDYLTFHLAGELHAVPVAQVHGVLALPTITAVPNLPSFMRGVIHHEGAIVPVMDLALRLGMDATISGAETCVVLVRVPHSGRVLTMGMIVTEVQDVVVFDNQHLLPSPEFGVRLDTRFLLGLVRHDAGTVTLLLDLERVLNEEELTLAAGSAQ